LQGVDWIAGCQGVAGNGSKVTIKPKPKKLFLDNSSNHTVNDGSLCSYCFIFGRKLPMQLPFFYINPFDPSQQSITLDEDTSRHVIQVLRMKTGEQLRLTDGKGYLLTCRITAEHKKHCEVERLSLEKIPAPVPSTTIAISLLKNANRFEWFLEKATELGIHRIIPIVAERTEKEKFRHDRMQTICTSAMLQSQQCWLPELSQPVAYSDLFKQPEILEANHRFIAHCIETDKQQLVRQSLPLAASRYILIGPEGDFTPAEIALALEHTFIPVALGDTRLRTETAGVVAATLLQLVSGV